MHYSLGFINRAARQFKKLPKDVQKRLKPKISALAQNPRPSGAKKLAGEEDTWRIVVGKYRVIYEVHDDKLIILVVGVGHRREIYQ